MFCPECGTESDEAARFCRNCGSALATQPLPATSRFPDAAQAAERDTPEADRRPSLWRRRLWPPVDTLESAEKAISQAFWVAIVGIAGTVLYVALSLSDPKESPNPESTVPSVVVAIIFGFIAWGLRAKSRGAALAGLLLYVSLRLYMWGQTGITSPAIPVIFTLAFIGGVRGSYSWHRLAAMPPAVDEPTRSGVTRCPTCGAPYDSADYRPDAEAILCTSCHGPLPLNHTRQ
jgi:hypothetical protein